VNKRVKVVLVFVCALLCLPVSVFAQTATFEFLNPPGGPTWSNYSLARNGVVMAANVGGDIYRWTENTGFVFLGHLDFLSSSVGISADGTAIVASRQGSDGNVNPTMWKRSTGWVDLGHPSEGCVLDGSWGSAYDVNADGTAVVGLAWYCPGAEGFLWTPQNGMVGLGHPPRASSRASAISADGKTIVGFYEHPQQGYRRPVVWRNGHAVLIAGANSVGEATGVSSNGNRVTGQADDGSGIAKAFHYTGPTGVVSIGTLSGNPTDQSMGNAVSDHGTVIGFSGDPFFGGSQAFIWDSKHGIRPLRRVLNAMGANIPADISLVNALDISADGSTIVGIWQDNSFNQGGFMARMSK
jgi:uncharacterized membrane protein